MKQKRFKRIYVEITNKCNLHCSFCSKLNRKLRTMSVDEFSKVIDEIKEYTDYIYLHVKGEPLFHPNFKEILEVARDNNICVNITTNGVYLGKMMDILFMNNSIRQLNVSLHALEQVENKDQYLQNLVYLIKKVNETKKFYLSLRIWIDNERVNRYIEDYLQKELGNYTASYLGDNVFWSFDKEFEWPSLESENLGKVGKCLGTKTHIAILANGDVVPCCLDGDGVMVLGNVYENSLKSILESKRFNDINKGFNENKLVEELCQKCKYRRK